MSSCRRVDPDAGAASNEVLCRIRVAQDRIAVPKQCQLHRVQPCSLQTDDVASDPCFCTSRAQGIIKPVLSQIEAVVIGPKYKGHVERSEEHTSELQSRFD